MKKILSLLIIVSSLGFWIVPSTTIATDYKPNWESLDSRETPKWYPDAKFGIFIHWGLYSVPSFSPRGTYSEWYWHAKKGDQTGRHQAAVGAAKVTRDFHNRVYGEDFRYSDFRSMFTCELFDPTEWANVFKRSGAKYVVLTSKHHDGYCLWPNSEASESFGMPWNSVESGPKRDLMRDLGGAVRDVGLKMGYYYSIWDWFNPLWPEEDQPTRRGKPCNEDTLNDYVKKVMYPQFKELVTEYEPALIFSDGDWWMDDEKWQTKPLLAWLFNNAPNKDEVVINDRWGKVRKKHGGYYTTEYGSGFDDPTILWEENRGIGKSFGYNRVESYDDYNSTELLIYMLCDIVSRGGNFLLDIGPTADGRIPVVMQDRLINMGEWLDVNGEAIFETRRWKRDCQWSEGKILKYTQKEFHKGVPDPIIEMARYPREGQARKECYFTSKGDTVYALITKLPDDGTFEIKDIELSANSEITMLGFDGSLKFVRQNGGLMVKLPSFNPSTMPCEYVYTLKLTKVR